MPTPVLIATGAEFVVAGLAAALVTIGVLYLFDDRALHFDTQQRLAKAARLREELQAQEQIHSDAASRVEGFRADVALVSTEPEHTREFGDKQEAKHLEASREKDVEAARRRVGELTTQQERAEEDLAQANRTLEQAHEDLKQKQAAVASESTPTRWDSARRGLMPAGLLTVTAFIAAEVVDLGYAAPQTISHLWISLVALFAGVVGAVLYRNTNSFPVLGLVALIAVPLVMGVATYLRDENAPRVEPVALLKTDGTPFVGFFLAESSDRVFVGTFIEKGPDPCAGIRRGPCESGSETIKVPARLLSLPSSDVRDLTVGPAMPLNANNALDETGRPRTAREWAGHAALLLCKQARIARGKAEVNAGGGGAAPTSLPTKCSKDDIARLREFVLAEQKTIQENET
ncbi:MAG: hypothetical protein AABM66_07135 [Actinomycetota bacterium]